MMKVLAWSGRIGLVLVAFMIYLLGLLKVFPVLIGSLLLFLSILFAFRPFYHKQKFKGFRL